MEYWHDILIEKSWQKLQQLKKKFKFTLIGGWAVYLWAKSHKSKDIDLIVDLQELEKMKQTLLLKKNNRLRKYEASLEEIDVDIYVTYYSKLALPLEEIINLSTEIQGFKVLQPEPLLILKQAAELQRKASEKGLKDRIDIMDLLFKAEIDFKKYSLLLEKFGKKEFKNRLIEIINSFREIKYLDLNPREFKKKKLELLEKIKKEKRKK